MKKMGFSGLVMLIIIGYFVINISMQPKFKEVTSIREDNDLTEILFFTGDDTYVYQVDEPHAVYVEYTRKKFVWWKLKYRYEVRYLPSVLNGKQRTWDPDKYTWGDDLLDEIIYIDGILY